MKLNWLGIRISILLCGVGAVTFPTAAASKMMARNDGVVQLEHEIQISAPASAVWNALTAPEDLRWLAPQSKVELRIGGAYEHYFTPDDPKDRGMEGTKILAFVPEAMLANSGEIPGTWVVWCMHPAGNGTLLKVSSMGTSEEWRQRAPSFDAAMPRVLRRLADSVEGKAP